MLNDAGARKKKKAGLCACVCVLLLYCERELLPAGADVRDGFRSRRCQITVVFSGSLTLR